MRRAAALDAAPLARRERTGASARVERDESMFLRDPHHREHVAAEARHHRFGDREDGGGSDRCINGVATAL